MSSDYSVTIVRRIKASPARVYAAWTEPEMLAQWFGPKGSTLPRIASNPRVGGRLDFLFVIEGTEYSGGGVYRELVPERRVVVTWEASEGLKQNLVTIEIMPDGDGCMMILTHGPFPDGDARDSHINRWAGALDKFEGYAQA